MVQVAHRPPSRGRSEVLTAGPRCGELDVGVWGLVRGRRDQLTIRAARPFGELSPAYPCDALTSRLSISDRRQLPPPGLWSPRTRGAGYRPRLQQLRLEPQRRHGVVGLARKSSLRARPPAVRICPSVRWIVQTARITTTACRSCAAPRARLVSQCHVRPAMSGRWRRRCPPCPRRCHPGLDAHPVIGVERLDEPLVGPLRQRAVAVEAVASPPSGTPARSPGSVPGRRAICQSRAPPGALRELGGAPRRWFTCRAAAG